MLSSFLKYMYEDISLFSLKIHLNFISKIFRNILNKIF